jgi:hypothetical protein
MKTKAMTFAAVSIVALLGDHAALAQDIDVGFHLVNGRLTTRQVIDDVPGSDDRLFTGGLDLIGGAVFGDEPGFRIDAGTFDQAGNLTISIRRAMRAWNGGGFSPTSDRLNIQKPGSGDSIYSPIIDPVDPDSGPLPGISFAVGTGELHEHADNYLVDALTLGNGAPGIYLVEFHAAVDLAGIARTAPYYLLYNYGQSDADLSAAVDYTRANILPSPGVLAPCAIALIGLRRRRGVGQV